MWKYGHSDLKQNKGQFKDSEKYHSVWNSQKKGSYMYKVKKKRNSNSRVKFGFERVILYNAYMSLNVHQS